MISSAAIAGFDGASTTIRWLVEGGRQRIPCGVLTLTGANLSLPSTVPSSALPLFTMALTLDLLVPMPLLYPRNALAGSIARIAITISE